jgi:uncharacterized membrane protein YedE/YeeE
MQGVLGALAGSVFGIGLVLSGMAQPQKVIGFLDLAGDWDPSLAFVMAGAIAVYAPLYRYILKRTTPLYAQRFFVVANNEVDARLVLGAGVFGLGWGLAGYCPGPGIVSAGSGASAGLTFAVSMIAGMLLFELYQHAWRAAQGGATPNAAAKV